MTFVLQPAYGRDYKSKGAAVADFLEGKDFIHASRDFTGGGTYINRPLIPAGAWVQIRYAANRKVFAFRCGQEPAPLRAVS